MSIRSKVLREIEKKPRRLKELKEKLGNDKKVQRAVEELLAKGGFYAALYQSQFADMSE